ncbi:MAG: 4Fe-4S binding protein [Deltaproteobacteria bacterium]|nr:4Fe-4S binding protein [Deltaproteobacteria bacterium]
MVTGKDINKAFVRTAKEKCRVCYTCVRECPAKAIRIFDGQAEIIADRCIACGNCVKVCSQNAKQIVDSSECINEILNSSKKVAACIAPSFPADFSDVEPEILVGMLSKLGFDYITEVSFGADLVAYKYKELIENSHGEKFIATTCPAIVAYIERYQVDAFKNLAPIVSPMIAHAKVLKQEYGEEVKLVFIGPCIAKKMEAASHNLSGYIDCAITFKELKQLFEDKDITAQNSFKKNFDPPYPGLGSLFPLNGGMLQASDIKEDLVLGDIVAADGLSEFVSAIGEFADGNMDVKLLEVLSCEGCIMGPGMTTDEPKFRRRSRVSNYVRNSGYNTNNKEHLLYFNKYKNIDLSRNYTLFDQRIPSPSNEELNALLKRLGKESEKDELNCQACGYTTCREHAIAIHKGLAEDEMCLPFVIEKLKNTVNALSVSHKHLEDTKDQLLHSEKLASMGQLAAGVAHELNNPLGVVLMYSHLLLDDLDKDTELYQDLKMITQQAERGKKIVANLLDFARENKVLIEEVDIKTILKRAVQSTIISDNINVSFNFNHKSKTCEMDRDQMLQVFTNIISNANAAMENGGKLIISTDDNEAELRIRFSDNGEGIEKNNLDKIFQPFFTTRKMGKGTGLGLAVSYGIVKMHRGRIEVKSNADKEKGETGSEFQVCLPRFAKLG